MMIKTGDVSRSRRWAFAVAALVVLALLSPLALADAKAPSGGFQGPTTGPSPFNPFSPWQGFYGSSLPSGPIGAASGGPKGSPGATVLFFPVQRVNIPSRPPLASPFLP